MIPRWLLEQAEHAGCTLTELVPPGGSYPLIFGSNGTLLRQIKPTDDLRFALFIIRMEFTDPATVFYADPYYD